MTGPDLPWARVEGFIREHTHAVRNRLNGLELEAALVKELVAGGEAAEGVARIRRQLRSLAGELQSLSRLFKNPQPVAGPIAARELLLIWRDTHAALPVALEVRWEDELGEEEVNVDAAMIAQVFRELLANAAAFSRGDPVTVAARAKIGEVVFELREPKQEAVDPSTWGEPFFTTRRGGYGLGLWAARRMVEANGATMVQRYVPEAGVLTTQIVLATR